MSKNVLHNAARWRVLPDASFTTPLLFPYAPGNAVTLTRACCVSVNVQLHCCRLTYALITLLLQIAACSGLFERPHQTILSLVLRGARSQLKTGAHGINAAKDPGFECENHAIPFRSYCAIIKGCVPDFVANPSAAADMHVAAAPPSG